MGYIFNILPTEGIEINGKIRILLGAKKDAADELLKGHKDADFDNSGYYYGSSLCIRKGNDNTVSEIELIRESLISVCIFDINPFKHKDEEIVGLLNEKLMEEPIKDGGSIEESTTVSWEKSGISLWRPTTPKKVLESAEEARADGFYEQWMKEEYGPSRYFQTILIKKPGR